MEKRNKIILLIILIVLFFSVNYSFLDKKLEKFLINYETAIVERIIDGDTVVINKNSVRLLGINSPERGEKYYGEAKEFLEKEIFNRTVRLEFGKEKEDLYGRILAYIFLGLDNVNLKLVEEGLANFYFPQGKDIHYNEFKEAWEKCIENNKNLCEKSKDKCAKCIELKTLDFKSQEVVFYNKCNFQCELTSWEIKDEGRKKFIFPEFLLNSNSRVKIKVNEGINDKENLFWENEEYVWTDTGDTLFLRDDSNKLVLWRSY